MAFTTFLMTVSMVGIASAGFPGWPANDNPFPGFSSSMFDINAPKIKPSKFNNFNNFKFEDINNFGFRHTFPDIDSKTIEEYVPGEGETFKGHSMMSHKFSTNINGQVSEGGSATRIVNDNGHVNKEKVIYGGDGTQS